MSEAIGTEETSEARDSLQQRIKEQNVKLLLASQKVEEKLAILRDGEELTAQVEAFGRANEYLGRVLYTPDWIFSMIEAGISADNILEIWNSVEDKSRRARGLETQTHEEISKKG